LLKDNIPLDRLSNAKDMDELWSFIIDHLSTDKNLEKKVSKHILKSMQNPRLKNRHFNIAELVKYMNVRRSLAHACDIYQPAERIKTPIHYFAASLSKKIPKEKWQRYSESQVSYYEVHGNHYTIFAKPNVVEFARTFDNVINKRSKK